MFHIVNGLRVDKETPTLDPGPVRPQLVCFSVVVARNSYSNLWVELGNLRRQRTRQPQGPVRYQPRKEEGI